MFLKSVAKHYILTVIIGTLLIFSSYLIKFIIKGTAGLNNIDILDVFIDIIIFIVFLVLVMVIRKTYKE